MKDSDFYIGWQPGAPGAFVRPARRVIALLLLLAMVTAAVLGLFQKKFSTGKFEYGQLTEVKGILQKKPVPSLKVMSGKDPFGNAAYITMPLVGYGKSGADGILAELEKESGLNFENREITFRGTLIYNDGKTLLQIDRHDHPAVKVHSGTDSITPGIKELGNVELYGEIIDPKCYFGVMKPGRGKPHRDCAIRCIEGGISPVFCVRNIRKDSQTGPRTNGEKAETVYYLLAGSNGERINEKVKDFIADPVLLKARAVQYDDWIILYLDKEEGIKRTGGLSWFKTDGTISCKPSGEQ